MQGGLLMGGHSLWGRLYRIFIQKVMELFGDLTSKQNLLMVQVV